MHFTYKCIHIHLCNSILVHVQLFPLNIAAFYDSVYFFLWFSFVYLMNENKMTKKKKKTKQNKTKQQKQIQKRTKQTNKQTNKNKQKDFEDELVWMGDFSLWPVSRSYLIKIKLIISLKKNKVDPLFWLLSNKRLAEVQFVKLLRSSPNRLLLGIQDKGSTSSLAHSLALPHFPVLFNSLLSNQICKSKGYNVCGLVFIETLNGWQLAKMKRSIPDMSLPWNL